MTQLIVYKRSESLDYEDRFCFDVETLKSKLPPAQNWICLICGHGPDDPAWPTIEAHYRLNRHGVYLSWKPYEVEVA